MSKSTIGLFLAALIFLGLGLPASAVTFQERMVQAKRGDPAAMSDVGWWLITGETGVQDPYEGRYWLERGAKAGNDWGMNNLGNYLARQGDPNGLNWLKKLANKKNAQPKPKAAAMVTLAFYLNGGAPIAGTLINDNKQAFDYLNRAAALKDRDAYFNLGLMYQKGMYVAKNKDKALYYFKLAAAQGHEQAQQKINSSWFW